MMVLSRTLYGLLELAQSHRVKSRLYGDNCAHCQTALRKSLDALLAGSGFECHISYLKMSQKAIHA